MTISVSASQKKALVDSLMRSLGTTTAAIATNVVNVDKESVLGTLDLLFSEESFRDKKETEKVVIFLREIMLLTLKN